MDRSFCESPIMKSSTRKLLLLSLVGIVFTIWLTSRGMFSSTTKTWIPEKESLRPRVVDQAGEDFLSSIKNKLDLMTDGSASVEKDEKEEKDDEEIEKEGRDLDSILNGKMPSFEWEEVNKRLPYARVNLDNIKQNKWIIVTSIAPPTKDVQFLAQLEGWKVLLVGDSKTPSDWSYPNCVYLSVEKQKQLGFNLVPMIPLANYCRKMVGYLYAIAHGAEVIYETDDDNRPVDKLESFVYTQYMPGLMFGGRRIFNPYRHYGQSTLWPRGYPLSMVGADNTNDYRLSSRWKTPVIQQGAVNGDPDMDAIFRLTRKMTTLKLDVVFDPAGPPVILPEGVFCPYNAQNTLYLKNSFWTFYLPLSATFRVTDIWRSYWSQRLLWEIDERFGYWPSNAYQQRNAHNYLHDMVSEEQLYTETEALLDFLYHWTCPEMESFFQCVYRLSIEMAEREFWGEIDIEGMKRWLEDLVRLGYKEPKRRTPDAKQVSNFQTDRSTNPHLESLRSETLRQGTYVHFVAAEQTSPTINRMGPAKSISALKQAEQIFSLCPNIDSLTLQSRAVTQTVRGHFEDILLVVVFNNPIYKNIPVLEVIYRSIFPNIAYCGSQSNLFFEALKKTSLTDKVTFLEMVDFEKGYLGYKCTSKAIDMNLNVTGYFFVGDDDIINIWKFSEYKKDRVWTNEYLSVFKVNQNISWPWWSRNVGKKPYTAAFAELRHWSRDEPPQGILSPTTFLKTLATNIGPYPNAGFAVSDIYYIPNRLKRNAQFYMEFFAEHKVFLELAIPMVLRGIDNADNFEKISGRNLYHKDRPDTWKKYEKDLNFVHPIKLSNSSNMQLLCSIYLPLVQNYSHSVYNVTRKFEKIQTTKLKIN